MCHKYLTSLHRSSYDIINILISHMMLSTTPCASPKENKSSPGISNCCLSYSSMLIIPHIMTDATSIILLSNYSVGY